jgi:hypothetical protein
MTLPDEVFHTQSSVEDVEENDTANETNPKENGVPTIEVTCEQMCQSVGSKRRLIIPLPDSPMWSDHDSPLSTSESEDFSPTIKLLDPAHRPSPRMIQALKRQHPPLTVLSRDQDESWSRVQQERNHSTPIHSRSSWRSLRSANSVDNFSSSYFPRLTSSSYRGSYEEIGDEGTLRRSRCCRCLKRIGVVVAAVSVALVVGAVPSIFLSFQMVGQENQDTLSLMRDRPEVAFPTW